MVLVNTMGVLVNQRHILTNLVALEATLPAPHFVFFRHGVFSFVYI